jgi:hypothetical protein
MVFTVTRARDVERMQAERVSALRSKLEDAFIYQHSIDRATYGRQQIGSRGNWHSRKSSIRKHESKASTSKGCSGSRST